MDLFTIITSSEKRKNLIILLNTGPKTWEEIRAVCKFPSAAIIPQIRILESGNVIIRQKGTYQLTTMGRIIAKQLKDLVSTVTVFEGQMTFWQEHDIDSIPDQFLMKIGDLGHVVLDEAQIGGIYQMKKEFLSHISCAKTIYGLIHTVHPLYPSFFLNLANKGADISFILTRQAFEITKADYEDELREWIEIEGIELSILDDDVRFSLITTDLNISLQLFLTNGVFDSMRELFSRDKRALQWGRDLFEYYRNRSVLVS
ncbi:MAG: winged helix-turn-helix domain-containing protein [Methanoregulaceae archaeon]|jgi:predicted transcriptional regulator